MILTVSILLFYSVVSQTMEITRRKAQTEVPGGGDNKFLGHCSLCLPLTTLS